MTNFYIGISGLGAAQKALEIIGNNIANAATPGYHRQRIELAPSYFAQDRAAFLGGGVDVVGVTRLVDDLLEREILRQQASLEQIGQEYTSLRTVENAFGELSSGGGLNEAMDIFFNALQDLNAHPGEIIYQNQALSATESMISKFRTLGEFLTAFENQIELEASNSVSQINTLTSQIAELNNKIKTMEISGTTANNLQDERDRCITLLAELIGVETIKREYGVVDVVSTGIPLVIGASPSALGTGYTDDGDLAISIVGSFSYTSDVDGGKLGGLLSLKNEILATIHDNIDDLAGQLVQQVNQYHVQGVGSEGSFAELTGWPMTSTDLADFDPAVSDGYIYIRVIDTSTGAITRNAVDVDVSADTLSTLATKISAITGLSASVETSKLHIQADTGYEFDFLPAVLPDPTASSLTGASPPTISVSGIYTGTVNQTFDFTVVGTGTVGNGTLQVEVRNGAAELVTTLNVGSGYAAGDKLDLGNGIQISLSTGDLNNGDTFEVDAFANTDTSGVLAAVGLNAFLSGSTASDIAVCSDISATPGRIATALGADMTDNANMLRLAALKEQSLSTLDDMTVGEFYRWMVTDIGQQVFVKQMQYENTEGIVTNLINQQGELSGVNINDEAARMIIFEQMFQAMAKYMNTLQTSLESLMQLV